MKEQDLDKIETHQKELEEAWHGIAQKLYEQNGGQQGGQGGFNFGDNPFGGANPFGGNGNPFGTK